MSSNAPVNALSVSFHANVPGHLLIHVNVVIRAEEMFSLRGQSSGYTLALYQLAQDKQTHTGTHMGHSWEITLTYTIPEWKSQNQNQP